MRNDALRNPRLHPVSATPPTIARTVPPGNDLVARTPPRVVRIVPILADISIMRDLAFTAKPISRPSPRGTQTAFVCPGDWRLLTIRCWKAPNCLRDVGGIIGSRCNIDKINSSRSERWAATTHACLTDAEDAELRQPTRIRSESHPVTPLEHDFDPILGEGRLAADGTSAPNRSIKNKCRPSKHLSGHRRSCWNTHPRTAASRLRDPRPRT